MYSSKPEGSGEVESDSFSEIERLWIIIHAKNKEIDRL